MPLLNSGAAKFWPVANKCVRWGWKRDDGSNSRLVFYSGWLARRNKSIAVSEQYLLYVHKTTHDVAHGIAEVLERHRARIEKTLGQMSITVRAAGNGYTIVEASAGRVSPRDQELTRKLRRRRPRQSIGAVPKIKPASIINLDRLLPADLYIGSGLSYEAGLPTLCDMHQTFCVDNASGTGFAHGLEDRLPTKLARAPKELVARFCQVHMGALMAEPTRAMALIARLHTAGQINQVFTDNVDNLIAKTAVPFTRTRGSGVLNERYDVTLRSPRLIVIGVAADRREVIAQARAQHRKVIVVNPCAKVAPHVRHLTYLREGDLFLKTTADIFFRQLSIDLGI